jgi:hypothetical protein
MEDAIPLLFSSISATSILICIIRRIRKFLLDIYWNSFLNQAIKAFMEPFQSNSQ